VTTYQVYLGETGPGGLPDRGGNFATGDTPRRIGPQFPSMGSHGAWSRACGLIESLGGIRIDWGAIAARVGVDDLRWFLSETYGVAVPTEVTDLLAGLDPDRGYVLVAMEH